MDFVDNIMNSGLETTATVHIGQDTVALKAVFEKRYRDDSIADMTVEGYTCKAFARLRDVPGIRQGDQIDVGGVSYLVSGREYDEELVVLWLTEK